MDNAIEIIDPAVNEGVSPVQNSPGHLSRPWWQRPIPLTLGLGVVVATAYVAFERIGTTANADTVEFTPNLVGGFLAVGMTEHQPGFVVMSLLGQDEVTVNAAQVISTLAGSHTIVDIQTPRGSTHTRLRGPQVILVSEDGAVETHSVEWTLDDFNTLRKAADCSYEAATAKSRCGAPFTDLHEAFARWSTDRVPERVRIFLAPFADPTAHENKTD